MFVQGGPECVMLSTYFFNYRWIAKDGEWIFINTLGCIFTAKVCILIKHKYFSTFLVQQKNISTKVLILELDYN